MFGLAVLVVGAIYLAVLIAVTRIAYSSAKKRGYSKAKCWLAAAGGFLIVYLPVFWDHIPTVVAHQYYCAKDSGFWVYKTLDQWKAENPGVAETLVANKTAVSIQNAYVLNQRFNWAIYERRYFPLNHMMREEWQVVDNKTGEVLARYVNYAASHERRQAGWTGWKFWLDSPYCMAGRSDQDAFRNVRDDFRGNKK
jgi:hypothetical protein